MITEYFKPMPYRHRHHTLGSVWEKLTAVESAAEVSVVVHVAGNCFELLVGCFTIINRALLTYFISALN